MENENNNLSEENEIKVTNEITPEPNEVSPEALEEMMNNYKDDVSSAQSETKKVLMLTALGAIIIAIIVAVALAMQKTPQETIKLAINNTFSSESLCKRKDFLTNLFLNEKAELKADLHLDSISASEENTFNIIATDLKTTKPTINLNLKTDLKNEQILLNLLSKVEKNIEGNPFFNPEDLEGDTAKIATDTSFFINKGDISIFNKEDCAKINNDILPNLNKSIEEYAENIKKTNIEEISKEILNILIDNSTLRNSNTAYGYNLNGVKVGANKYTISFSDENLKAINSKLNELSEKYSDFDFTFLTNLLATYTPENYEIAIFERNCYIKGLSINTLNSNDETENEIPKINFEILFIGNANPYDEIRTTLKVDNFSINLTDSILSDEYIVKITNFSFDDSEFSCALSGNITFAKTSEDLAKNVPNATSSEDEFEKFNNIYADTIDKITMKSIPTFISMLYSQFGF